MKILVIEDDPVVGQALCEHLARSGFDAVLVADGADGEHRLAVERFDLLVLDLGLPGIGGLEILRRLRARGDHLPVLIITARDELEDRVRGLKYADDYLCKPFAMVELVARARALLRRAYAIQMEEVAIGKLRLDVAGRQVRVGSEALTMSAREFAILEILMLREGRVVTKEDIMARVYESDSSVGANAIEVFLHRIRRKIGGSGASIRTIRGLGYLLEKEVDAGT